jgi:two-component system response regulator MprA
MSPVAADTASADSAPAPDPPVVDPVDPVDPPDDVDVGWLEAADDADDDEEDDEPQPATATDAITSMKAGSLWMRFMAGSVAISSDDLLNGCWRPRGAARYLAAETMAPHLLIAEDEASLRDVLVRSLRAEGFAARGVGSGRELLDRAIADPPDAFVIDIGLPDSDGRDLCQALRAQGLSAPVLFLTARDALTDRLSGFAAGGDDYVTKPFDIEEVVVRLYALLKRSGAGTAPAAHGLTLDPSELTVMSDGDACTLTPTEFRLLAALAGRPGKAMARSELVRAAWPHGAIVQDNTLDVYIARLRRKLAQLPNAPGIKTVHGFGYQLK